MKAEKLLAQHTEKNVAPVENLTTFSPYVSKTDNAQTPPNHVSDATRKEPNDRTSER
jgi:hypothetical protein